MNETLIFAILCFLSGMRIEAWIQELKRKKKYKNYRRNENKQIYKRSNYRKDNYKKHYNKNQGA